MKSGRGRRSRIRRPRMRGRIGSRSSSMGSGRGSRPSSMSSGRGRRSSSLSSGRGRRSPSRTTSSRGGYGRRRRPMWRSRGMYPRRYRARPRSSGSCIVCFLILAVIILIQFAPSFIFVIAPEYSSTILIGAVAAFFIIALCFITQAVIDDDDDEPTSDDGGTTRTVEHERVLVVCPYCGNKNAQGLSKCQSCNADL